MSCWGFSISPTPNASGKTWSNTEKTRLIRFGRFAAQQRAERGLGKPETFDFLGFTHYCAKRRDGHFAVRRRTIKKRQAAKLGQVKTSLMARRHWPIEEQGRWLGSVVRGHLAYYSVPGNIQQVTAFREEVIRLWRAALRRRSQKTRMNARRQRTIEFWHPTGPRAKRHGTCLSLRAVSSSNDSGAHLLLRTDLLPGATVDASMLARMPQIPLAVGVQTDPQRLLLYSLGVMA